MSFTLPDKGVLSLLSEGDREEVERRLDEAESYLELILARRARGHHRLDEYVRRLLSQRLLAAEDWVRLDLVDWARVCAILLPEVHGATLREYTTPALTTWTRLCDELLPESHRDRGTARPTDEQPTTPEKVGVMETRAEMQLPLFHDGDARDDDAYALLVDGEAGNGKVAPAHVDDEPVARLLVRLQGEGRARIGEEEVPAAIDPAWRASCTETLKGKEPQDPVAAFGALSAAGGAAAYAGVDAEEYVRGLREEEESSAVPRYPLPEISASGNGHLSPPAQLCLWHALERCLGPCALDGDCPKTARVKARKKERTPARHSQLFLFE